MIYLYTPITILECIKREVLDELLHIETKK